MARHAERPGITSDPADGMTFRRLRRSGLTVSTVGIGCNDFGLRLGLDDSRPVVHAALE